MPRLLAFLILIASSARAMHAQSPLRAPHQHSDSIVALVDRFLADPLTNAALAQPILDSSKVRRDKKHDVRIDLNLGFMPWLCGIGRASPTRFAFAKLVGAAYEGGDMREQFLVGTKQDQPLAGIQAVLTVYRQIRGRGGPETTDPTIDGWVALDSLNRLRTHVDSLVAHPPQYCP